MNKELLSESLALRIGLCALIIVALVLLVPSLISASSTLAVMVGVVLTIGGIFGIAKILTSQTKEEEE